PAQPARFPRLRSRYMTQSGRARARRRLAGGRVICQTPGDMQSPPLPCAGAKMRVPPWTLFALLEDAMTTPRLITTTCLATVILPAAAHGQPLGADDYILNALIRDMKPGHQDFTDVSPDAYARIAGLAMPAAGAQPDLTPGGGAELEIPARDAKGNIVPPHLATTPSGPGAGKTSIASTGPTILKDGA